MKKLCLSLAVLLLLTLFLGLPALADDEEAVSM